jgi:hypothetical protein
MQVDTHPEDTERTVSYCQMGYWKGGALYNGVYHEIRTRYPITRGMKALMNLIRKGIVEVV